MQKVLFIGGFGCGLRTLVNALLRKQVLTVFQSLSIHYESFYNRNLLKSNELWSNKSAPKLIVG